jgi:basic membrane protein A
VKYTGDFEDVSKGKDLSSILYSQGVDIIYHASGKCGLGAIEAAKNQKNECYVIGVDGDQDSIGVVKDNEGNIVKTVVLTSMMKHVDVAIFDVSKLEAEREFISGHRVYGLKEGGVSLT